MPMNGSLPTVGAGSMAKRRGEEEGRFCRYGAWYLSRIHREFCAEIRGVKEGRDPEAVHRMRVASRRLRAGIPLFSRCFSRKAYQKVSRGVRRITRDLGDARDLDVQIAYLEGLVESLREDGGPQVNGCIALLSRKKEERDALQPKVIADCSRLEQKGILSLLEEEIGAWNTPDGPPHRLPSRGFPMKRSGKAIQKKVEKLLSYSPAVGDPDAVEAHHAMRIAAKRLRYIIEVYAPLYRNELKPVLKRLKALQEILGNLHDCDVWIMDLQEALKRREDPSAERDPGLEAGMAFILKDQKKARAAYYLALREEWEALVASGLFSDLKDAVSSGVLH